MLRRAHRDRMLARMMSRLRIEVGIGALSSRRSVQQEGTRGRARLWEENRDQVKPSRKLERNLEREKRRTTSIWYVGISGQCRCEESTRDSDSEPVARLPRDPKIVQKHAKFLVLPAQYTPQPGWILELIIPEFILPAACGWHGHSQPPPRLPSFRCAPRRLLPRRPPPHTHTLRPKAISLDTIRSHHVPVLAGKVLDSPNLIPLEGFLPQLP